jgi:hypothetical protein
MFPCSDVALVLSIFTSEFETEYEGEQQYIVANAQVCIKKKKIIYIKHLTVGGVSEVGKV